MDIKFLKKLTVDELGDLNRAIMDEYDARKQDLVKDFQVGDTVTFKNCKLAGQTGVVTKVNRKRVVVKTPAGTTYRTDVTLLSK